MKEQNMARAYAGAIASLGTENKVDIAAELTKLTEVINASNDLETLLFLDVFTIEEKTIVLKEVVKKLDLSPIVVNFLLFLLEEKRMGIFPLIFKEVVVRDDHNKGFLRGTIEGRGDSVSDEFLTKIKAYLKEKMGKDAQLEYIKTEEITAGYRVTVEDLQVDASLDNQLNKFKESVLNS
jgi:F-type H+-transporting ATPase subunit delta